MESPSLCHRFHAYRCALGRSGARLAGTLLAGVPSVSARSVGALLAGVLAPVVLLPVARFDLALLAVPLQTVALPAGAHLAGLLDVAALLHASAWFGSVGVLAATAGPSDVEALIERVERVAEGDYDVDFDLDREDDLGRLAGALDEMVAEIDRRERDLEREVAYTDDVLDAIDDVFYVLDREGAHRKWNDTVVEVTGYDPDEVARMHPLDYFEGEDEATIAAAIDEAFETGGTRVEAALRTKAGESIPYEWVATRLTAPDGTPVVAGIGRDVSDRVETERRLRERERHLERYREYTDAILDSIDDVFYVVGPDGSFQRWNQSLVEATGYTDEEVAEMAPLEFVVEEDREAIADAIQEAIETGSARAEARVLTRDGEEIPYEFLGSKLQDPDGNPVLVGVGRDVSERTVRERELQRTKHLLREAQQIARVGGWELDLRSEPHTFEGTDEFYEIHGLPRDASIPLDRIVECYHPEDRDYIQRLMTAAIEEGTSYDMEVRLSTTDVGERWVRAIAEPVVEDGEVVALRGSVQNVTDRKEQERTLESLHDVARGMLEVESRDEVARVGVDGASTVLGSPCVAVYLLEEESGRLEPTATSDEFERVCRDSSAGFDAESGSIIWEAYVGGSVQEVDSSDFDDVAFRTDEAYGALLVPIGEHGVLLVASVRDDHVPDDRRIVETLAATMESALDRIESEAALRANQSQLEAQNRRLRRQIQITEIIRRVDRSLVGASTREEIETAVCERLVESDDVAFAWIGTLDERGSSLVPRAWAGTGNEYLDAVTLDVDVEDPNPAVRSVVDGTSTVVESVVEAVTTEEWRRHALVHDFSSVVAVPLVFDEYGYGVLAVYGSEPGAFGELERTVFEELGESIANAINAVEARRALYADEFVELRLRFDGDADFLGQIAAASGATVEYVGLATHAEDETRLFFESSGVEPSAVRTVLEERHSVESYRQIGDADGPTLFEATVAGTVLAARLVSRGGVPRSMVARSGELSVVVDVPTTTDVREFLEMLRERYPSVELVARRNVHRDVQTRQELVAGLFDGLTDRQIEVLRTAYYAGFFEWPRESTGEEVAELLGVSQPTVNRHVRHGLQRLLRQLFEEEPTAVTPA